MDMLRRTEREQKILFVLSNVSNARSFYNSGPFVPEIAYPYTILSGGGYEKSITFASPEGGFVMFDQDTHDKFQNDAEIKNFLRDYNVQQMMNNTVPLSILNPNQEYDMVYVLGGYGPIVDLVDNDYLNNIIKNTYEKGGVVAASTFGTIALASVKLSNGKSLLANKRVTCFSDQQMKVVNLDKLLPRSVEQEVRRLAPDAKLEFKKVFHGNIVVDERIITTQYWTAGEELGRTMVNMLQQSSVA